MNQTHQETFTQENRIAILDAKDILTRASQRFMHDIGKIQLPENLHALVLAALRDNLVTFSRAIRGAAVYFTGQKHYWDLVDALQFFEDATGVMWKYMTMDGRNRSLKWSCSLGLQVLRGLQHSNTETTFLSTESLRFALKKSLSSISIQSPIRIAAFCRRVPYTGHHRVVTLNSLTASGANQGKYVDGILIGIPA